MYIVQRCRSKRSNMIFKRLETNLVHKSYFGGWRSKIKKNPLIYELFVCWAFPSFLIFGHTPGLFTFRKKSGVCAACLKRYTFHWLFIIMALRARNAFIPSTNIYQSYALAMRLAIATYNTQHSQAINSWLLQFNSWWNRCLFRFQILL